MEKNAKLMEIISMYLLLFI